MRNAARGGRDRLIGLDRSGARALAALIARSRQLLDARTQLLNSLGYHNVLARGFTLVRDAEGRMLRRAAEVSAGERLRTSSSPMAMFRPRPMPAIARRRRARNVSVRAAAKSRAHCYDETLRRLRADVYGDENQRHEAGRFAVMNRFERNLGFKGEARLEISRRRGAGADARPFRRRAVTGRTIPLDELRYWSVDLQEAYVDAAASLKRFREIHATPA